IDVLAKHGEEIVGYGVVELVWQEDARKFTGETLKFVVLFQSEGEYRAITEEQAIKEIERIKK
ncbi:MAG: hypothetical protein J6Z36_03540, partial [Clostridia bacterium]|nr:hypothetical protein [Clostridia bacterium]